MSTEENKGYVLRVNVEFSLDDIVAQNRYYSGIMRHWHRGSPVLFLRKTPEGDAFVAYGVIDNIEMLWEMTPSDEDYAKENGWKISLKFRNLIVFKTPLLYKESPMKTDPRKGAFLHGVVLSENLVMSILDAAENIQKIDDVIYPEDEPNKYHDQA